MVKEMQVIEYHKKNVSSSEIYHFFMSAENEEYCIIICITEMWTVVSEELAHFDVVCSAVIE